MCLAVAVVSEGLGPQGDSEGTELCSYLGHSPAIPAVEVRKSPFDCLDSEQIQRPRMTVTHTDLGHMTLLDNYVGKWIKAGRHPHPPGLSQPGAFLTAASAVSKGLCRGPPDT